MRHAHEHAGACFVCAAAEREFAERAPEEQTSPPSSVSRRRFLAGTFGAALATPLAAPSAFAAARGESFAGARSLGRRYVIEAGQALVESAGAPVVRREVSILVNDDRVEAVLDGFGGARRSGRVPRLDARTHLVTPGFISGHTHVAGGTTTRGIFESGRSFALPLELADTLSDGELDAITAFNLMELMLSGCTTQVEMALSLKQAESYVRVARRLGARGYPGGMIPGIHRLFPIWLRGSNDQVLHDSVPGTLAEIQANLEFGRRHMGAENGRIRPMMSPHATDTQTPETMRAIAAAARELGTGAHFHLSQSAGETATVRRLWGMTPTQWCDSFGLLDGPFFGAHMSGLDFAVDPPLLNAKGAVYSHCPSAGGAGGGTQPYPEALTRQMRVNIGIDTHSNDYVENLKLAVLYGQARRSLLQSSTNPLTNPTMALALDGATRVAADALRRPDLGRIAPGAKADLVSIDVTGPLVGVGTLAREPLNNLLYAHGSSVRHVLIDGEPRVLDGRFVADDVARITREARRAIEHLYELLEARNFFAR